MTIRYLKNLQTNKIISGEAFGASFDEWQELTQSEIDAYELKQAKLAKIAQCKTYLNNTDWQIIALTERNRAVDENVVINRPLAVSRQAEINTCTTIEELNNINTDFNGY
jgi:hypothetical protein